MQSSAEWCYQVLITRRPYRAAALFDKNFGYQQFLSGKLLADHSPARRRGQCSSFLPTGPIPVSRVFQVSGLARELH